YFALAPLPLPQAPYDFTVKPGASLKSVSRQLAADGLLMEPYTFWIMGRLLGKAGAIQAGTYRVQSAITPMELLDKLARGDVFFVEVALIEGTTFRQWLEQLRADARVKPTLGGKAPAEIAAIFGIEQPSPEGWFFPDTYRFSPGTPDIDILKRAHAAMAKRLADAWAARDPSLPLRTPYEALILASIVEKETAVADERPLVASVFVNRLKGGMRLQTDPTVIYGMGETYEGTIRKKDLNADTPWNTYTRDGLPPTPIAMPGAAAIAAAVKPADTDFLYFVAKGDGTHQFSRSLEEHNRAVAKYQLHK
ncbi:MAG: endolytic transglycosylase MltG, partial [Bacillota bacterium]